MQRVQAAQWGKIGLGVRERLQLGGRKIRAAGLRGQVLERRRAGSGCVQLGVGEPYKDTHVILMGALDQRRHQGLDIRLLHVGRDEEDRALHAHAWRLHRHRLDGDLQSLQVWGRVAEIRLKGL